MDRGGKLPDDFVPFLFAAIPPLVDYPNHLARLWLLAGGVKEPALAPLYSVQWPNASTNIGVDLAAASLASFAPAVAVAHVAALAAALLPPLGALALSWRTWRRVTLWQALFPIAAWSTTMLMGFLNFQIGIGLALLFAAADPWLRSRLGASPSCCGWRLRLSWRSTICSRSCCTRH